ncbi:AI-2E family transporter [Anaerotignum sp.]|nr:AI-2E family transporter [Anaerotignum sp.]MBP3628252.1 AI-2E family transporter [Anaerotignum sp.]MBQ8734182.1 AI-2E family transporter [Anaerotignum sp.]
MQLDRENIRKLRGLIVFTLVILVGLLRFDVVLDAVGFLLHILFPFLLGGAIAFVLSVPMNRIDQRLFGKAKEGSKLDKASAPLSLVITLVLVLAVLSLVVIVVLPELGSTIAMLGKTLPEKVPALLKKIEALFANNPNLILYIEELESSLNWDEILNQMVTFFRIGANTMLDSTISVATGIVSGVGTFFIAFVFACYILLQQTFLRRQMTKLFFAYLKEKHAQEVLRICSLTYRTFSNFLTGQCMEAVILGLMFFIAMTIFRFPFAVLVGVLIAFTALIPIFGAFIGCFVGAFLILTVDPKQALFFVIMFLILQQIEGNLIYPKVVGGSIGLPAIWVLAAVSLGGSLFGVVGMLVFIPIVSVLYTLLKENVNKRLDEKQIHIE